MNISYLIGNTPTTKFDAQVMETRFEVLKMIVIPSYGGCSSL